MSAIRLQLSWIWRGCSGPGQGDRRMSLSWMAWTWPTAAFFVCIALGISVVYGIAVFRWV